MKQKIRSLLADGFVWILVDCPLCLMEFFHDVRCKRKGLLSVDEMTHEQFQKYMKLKNEAWNATSPFDGAILREVNRKLRADGLSDLTLYERYPNLGAYVCIAVVGVAVPLIIAFK